MQDVVAGNERVRAWPQPKPKRRPKAEREREEKFRAAQMATKYWAPQLYLDAMNMVEGTPLLPRDIMTMIMYQRFAKIIMPDGKVLWPMAARQEVSEALDTLSQTDGNVLVRRNGMWVGEPFGGGGGPGLAIAQMRRNGAWTFSTAGFQGVPFNQAAFDPQGWTVPASFGFRPTVPGFYLALAMVSGNSAAPQGLQLRKNGIASIRIGTFADDTEFGVGGVGLVQLNGTTDLLTLHVFCTANIAMRTSELESYFHLVGPLS